MFLLSFCVTVYQPTPAMYSVGNKLNISVTSIDEFRAHYIPATKYFAKRETLPYGSAVDPESGEKIGLGKPETFNFLGFTFKCGQSRRANFLLKRKSQRDRMKAKLQEVKGELRRRMH
jgi:hypothetical protein